LPAKVAEADSVDPPRTRTVADFASLLFAPVSVAVGLVFFAMGSMVALVVDGRVIHLSVGPARQASIPTATALPPPVVAGPAGPTHEATTSAPDTSSLETAAVPAAPSAPPSAIATAAQRPQGTAVPLGTVPQRSKRPPIIF
jgi:hypothetical protein